MMQSIGADFTVFIHRQQTHLQILAGLFALCTMRSKVARQASLGDFPWRIISTTKKLAALRIISSPTPDVCRADLIVDVQTGTDDIAADAAT